MKPDEEYSIEKNRLIAETNFIDFFHLNDIPNKFPAASQIPGRSRRTILDPKERFVAGDFDVLSPPSGSFGRDDIAKIVLEAATRKIDEQALEALQDVVDKAEDTALDVKRLSHVNVGKSSSGWHGISAASMLKSDEAENVSFGVCIDIFKTMIRNLVRLPVFAEFFSGVEEIAFMKMMELIMAPKYDDPGSQSQNPHLDTNLPDVQIEGEMVCPAFTAVITITTGPSTLFEVGDGDAMEVPCIDLLRYNNTTDDFVNACMQPMDVYDENLAPGHVTVFKNNRTAHAGSRTPKNFCCPITKSKNRVTLALFFTPAVLEPLHDDPLMSLEMGFGSGILETEDFNMEEIANDYLAKADAFTDKCAKLLMKKIPAKRKKSTKTRKKPKKV
jgi:hypothetical protein